MNITEHKHKEAGCYTIKVDDILSFDVTDVIARNAGANAIMLSIDDSNTLLLSPAFLGRLANNAPHTTIASWVVHSRWGFPMVELIHSHHNNYHRSQCLPHGWRGTAVTTDRLQDVIDEIQTAIADLQTVTVSIRMFYRNRDDIKGQMLVKDVSRFDVGTITAAYNEADAILLSVNNNSALLLSPALLNKLEGNEEEAPRIVVEQSHRHWGYSVLSLCRDNDNILFRLHQSNVAIYGGWRARMMATSREEKTIGEIHEAFASLSTTVKVTVF